MLSDIPIPKPGHVPLKSMAIRVAMLLVYSSCLTGTICAAEPPNIVLILCDDLGYADVGFNGATDIKTPHLDRLAAGGTIFGSAYVTHPFCGPSRMGMMSGRYPHCFGAPFNLPNTGLGIEEYNRLGIPEGETLISTVLQDAGYFTGAIGKWHMGTERQYHPNNRGFDDFYGFLGGGHDYFPAKYGPIYERQKKAKKPFFNDYIVPLEHNGRQVKETEYLTEALSREGVRFVRQAQKKDAPFFLYLSYNAPHMPLQATDEDLARYADIPDEKRCTYAAMVHAVDRGVGRLVEALRKTDQFEDTLIVFLSDNGGKIGAGADNGPLKQGKGSVREGGYRVPMFFHWPKNVPAGRRYDHPVSAIDFYPTFAHLAGAVLPPDRELHGRNIWTDFLAGRSAHADDQIYVMRHHAVFSNMAVRKGQWKACCIGKRWELFNVNVDISEEHDLSAEYPDVLKAMVSEAEAWTRSHTQPQWFDNEKAGWQWKENGRPNHALIFQRQ